MRNTDGLYSSLVSPQLIALVLSPTIREDFGRRGVRQISGFASKEIWEAFTTISTVTKQ